MDESRLIRDGDLWAVFVGVNDYDDPEWSSLPYCDNDATCLASIFLDPVCGYPASNIRLLVNSSKNRHLRPTRSNIIAAINHLAQIADTEDAILFVFFGHGLNVDEVGVDTGYV